MSEEAAVASVSREQPWPGLMPFTEEARAFFHGRDNEAAELLRLIKRETLTVLFGQSGLGKSSLLNAGLFPRLRAEDLFPVYIRLDVSAQARPLAEQVLAAVWNTCGQHGVEYPGTSAGVTLWEFFHRKDADFWSARNKLLIPVLVLDQFEEIFTLGHHIEEMELRCRAFLEELADLVEDRAPAAVTRHIDEDSAFADTLDFSRHTYKVVLSFREDYLAEFEGLRGIIRSIMHNRLRLTRMNGEQAKQAILLSGGHLVADAVADQVIRFVAAPRATVRADDDLARLEVEPALLSVVCRELNNQRIRRRQPQITADMLHAGAQQQIIRDFYESSVAGIDARVREFIEDQLLTEAGYRDSYAYDDALAIPGVTRESIDRLIARRLLRLEERSGVLRVELTHDLLTQVARESRDQRQKLASDLRARELEATRRRRSRRFAAIGGFATVGAIALAVTFAVLLQQSTREKQKLIETQSYVLLSQANGQLDQNVAGEPQAILAKSLDLNPANAGAIGRAVAYLSQRTFPRSVAQYQLRTEPDDRYVSIGWRDATSVAFTSQKGGALIAVKADAATREVRVGAPTAASPQPHPRRITRGASVQAAWAANELPMTATADGKVIAWIERDRTLRVAWRDLGRDHGVEMEEGVRAPIVLSPDGRRLMARSAKGQVIVFAVLPQGSLTRLHAFDAADGSLRIGVDGQVVVALNKENVTVYDLRTDHLRELAHPLPVNSLEVSPDGKVVATACQDKFARLWYMDTGILVVDPLRHDGAVLSAAFSDDGEKLITGALDGTARVWSVGSGETLTEPVVTGTPVAEARISPDGSRALTYALDGRLGIWQIGNLQSTNATIQLPSNLSVMEVSPDRSLVLLATEKADVSLWRVADSVTGGLSATQVWARRAPEAVRQMRFSPDGRVIAIATASPRTYLWDAASGNPVGMPLRHRGPVLALRFSTDGALLATGSADGAARVWRVATQRLQGFPMPHGRERVGKLAFSHDGSLLLTGTSAAGGGSLRVWNLDEDILAARIPSGAYLALAEFSANREIVAVFDATIVKWVIDQRRVAVRWMDTMGAGEELPVYDAIERNRLEFSGVQWSAGISPDGARLVVGGIDGTSRIVDTATLRSFGEAMKGVGVVQAAEFSQDGRWIVTRSADRVARVWDGKSGYAVTDSARHDAELAGAVLAGGGAFFISAGRDRIVSLRKVGLDYPAPAPGWLPELVQVAGGGRFDQAGTMSWIADRGDRLRALGGRFQQEDASWWGRWASGTIARLASTGDRATGEAR